MKIYKLTCFKGREIRLQLLYTSKKVALSDAESFSKGSLTDIWMAVYVPCGDGSGFLKLESNECLWEK